MYIHKKSLLISFVQLGLYMKIPRRTLFVAQIVACILGTLTQSGSQYPLHL